MRRSVSPCLTAPALLLALLLVPLWSGIAQAENPHQRPQKYAQGRQFFERMKPYFTMQEAMATGKTEEARKAWRQLKEAVEAWPEPEWGRMIRHKQTFQALIKENKAETVEQQREAMWRLTLAISRVYNDYNSARVGVFTYICPRDNKEWFQRNDEAVKNPYQGPVEHPCGAVASYPKAEDINPGLKR